MTVWLLLAPTSASATIIKSPPWTDIFGGQWNDLNTMPAAQNTYNGWDPGYAKFKNTSPTAALSMGSTYAQSDAVWIAYGHGGAGFITFCSPPNGSSCTSVLRANSTVGSCAAPHDCLSDYPGASGPIGRMRLMAFVGCFTGDNTSNGSNLLDNATADGVSSAFGFTDEIYFGAPSSAAEYWSLSFTSSLKVGNSVAQAISDGKGNVMAHNLGFSFGFDKYYVKGGSVVTHPAAYG